MLSRRLLIACGLCAVTEFAAVAAADAQTPAPTAGLKRTILQRTDGPSPGYETVIVLVESDANALIAKHTHPGIESTYVLEGALTLAVAGQADRVFKAGEAFQVPTGIVHGGTVGAAPIKLVGNYIVEKGKPLASPA
jgi:quercetin dioxygenase-like cupin family protein